ncbi:hypothetical protein NE237_031051 [Protea cynaroides]|uniref:TF-B3 domain-containing protein n=1 Tax=Protea cynaroides TaxID=273540 RepID=A0A9Q0GZ13_9MAGN|nr:hypothetical protein NE237_031051 [Protea cynaroides]
MIKTLFLAIKKPVKEGGEHDDVAEQNLVYDVAEQSSKSSSSSSSSNINEVPDDELNLLLIPIKKAETYFPSLKKGGDGNDYNKMLLTFFDKHNKTWVMKYEFWSTSKCYVLTTGWKKFVKEYKLTGFVHEVFFYEIHDQLEVSDDQHLFIDFKKTDPPPISRIRLFGQNLIIRRENDEGV